MKDEVLDQRHAAAYHVAGQAMAFYLGMLSIAPKSNDPAALMQTVGTVSGAVGGIALVMIIFGLIGKKA